MAENEEKKVEDQDEEEFVMVGDGVEEGDQKVAAVDDDKEDESLDGDKRAGHAESEDDEKKDGKSAENKSRRARQKAARERDKRELKFLRGRNEEVERQLGELSRRQTQSEISQVDTRINQLDSAIRSADDVYAKAVSAGEGNDAAEAQRIRDTLKEQRDGLKTYKEQASTNEQTEDQVDPVLVENVRNWHGRNNWFDFRRQDEDSAIAGAIDDMLVRDGWDPKTPEYYDELDKRVARRLPHRAAGGSDDDGDDEEGKEEKTSKDLGGPRFRVGGRERSLKSNEVHISKARREAMEETGVWEDPILRKKYLKRYADWDLENANA